MRRAGIPCTRPVPGAKRHRREARRDRHDRDGPVDRHPAMRGSSTSDTGAMDVGQRRTRRRVPHRHPLRLDRRRAARAARVPPRPAQTTRAKVLLTSRRDEHRWLGELPQRVRLPPMPMRERLQLAHALARHLPAPRRREMDWRPAAVHRRQPADHHRHRPPSPARTTHHHRPARRVPRPGPGRATRWSRPRTPRRAAARPWPRRWPTASTTPSPNPNAPSWRCCTCSATPSTSTPSASWATPTSPRTTRWPRWPAPTATS